MSFDASIFSSYQNKFREGFLSYRNDIGWNIPERMVSFRLALPTDRESRLLEFVFEFRRYMNMKECTYSSSVMVDLSLTPNNIERMASKLGEACAKKTMQAIYEMEYQGFRKLMGLVGNDEI